jgi:hypothetical protein
MRYRSRLVVVLTLFGAVLLGACGGDDDAVVEPVVTTTTLPISSELATAREQWEAQGLNSYTFEFERRCFCPPAHYRVTVDDGVVTALEPLNAESPADAEPPVLSIEGLFDEIARATEVATGPVQVTYDPATGAPTEALIDWILDAIDDEAGWVITNIQPA